MMAFFLLLWLLGATTDEQKAGLADYFAPTTATTARASGAGGMLAGRSLSDDVVLVGEGGTPSVVVSVEPPPIVSGSAAPTDEEIEQAAAAAEQEMFNDALEQIKQALADSEELSELSRNLLMDMTSEGMRIQIIDQEGGSLFESGSARMAPHTRKLLAQIAQVVSRLPNNLSISGHTDASPFQRGDYGNWELSADRALASRRVLIESGIDPDRIAKVSGRADHEPLVAEDPFLPENRRISIVLLRGATVLPPELQK
jgi:chemotaxis protein MotB